MKGYVNIVCVIMTMGINALVFSQTSPPELISYQGVARDAGGNIIANQSIGIQLMIRQGSATGTAVFTEQHLTSTNALGIFTLQIGSVNTSAFQSIPWNNGPYFLEVQMDPAGGTNYVSIGTQQLLSVPYALYSKSSYSSAVSFASYTTANAPPISVTSNTSSTSTTLNITQGANTTSAVINFPPPPPVNVTISPSGIANVNPTTGNNFTVDVPAPSLNVVSGTNDATITITQGTASVSQVLNFPPASVPNVSINATGIVTVAPNSGTAFTIGALTPTLNSGNGINITGTYPAYTITNTAPDQTVTLAPGSNINVTGAYPNFSISSTPTLSIAGNNLSISGGNTVPLPASNITLTPAGVATVTPTTGNNFTVSVPAPTISATSNTTTGVATITLTQGASVATTTINMPVVNNPTITGAAPVNVTTVSANNYSISLASQTLSITGNGSTSQYSLSSTHGGTVALPLPSISINLPHSVGNSPGGYSFNLNIVTPTILPAFSTTNNVASVTSTATSLAYSITVPPASLTANTNTAGVTTFSLIHGPLTTTTSISAANLKAWSLSGNTVTASDYLGTNNNADLIFKTNSAERMRITSAGNIGIGTATPNYPLHTAYNGTNSAAHWIDYTSTATSGANSGIMVQSKATNGANIFGGYFQVAGSASSNTAAAVSASATSVSSNNYGINASATGTTGSGTNYGGYFYAANGNNNYGVYSMINTSDLSSAAIAGLSLGSGGSAGYFLNLNGSSSSPALRVVSNSTLAPIAVFTGSGNVGIGTNSPENILHVNGNEILSTGTLAGFKFRDRGGASTDNWAWYSSSNVARFWREGTGDIIGVTSSGRVGIGNTLPTAKLHVVETNSNNINTRIETGYLQYQPQGVISYTPGSVVMCNNAVGDLVYANSPPLTVFTGLNYNSVPSISTTPVSLIISPTSTLSFIKQYDKSVVEIDLYATISGTVSTTTNDLKVWIALDGSTSSSTPNYYSSIFRVQYLPLPPNSFEYYVHVKCYYYGPAGSHYLQVMCKVNIGNIGNVMLDRAGSNDGLIFVKENF
ncbi:MAG: hypothetical protein KatS3mg028_0196 [Bacteroidia bacterium]|nr:MAG: hypothetical protein KatS3mg028_0196 [Bacteroidia bacterium]